jgi:hypothetical protein
MVQRVAVTWTPRHDSQSTLTLLGTQPRQQRLRHPLNQLQSRVAIAGEVACRLDGQFASAERRLDIDWPRPKGAETRLRHEKLLARRVVLPPDF